MALVLLVICAGGAPAQTKISPEIEALKQKVEKLEQGGKLAGRGSETIAGAR
jgi:hypothetical protein